MDLKKKMAGKKEANKSASRQAAVPGQSIDARPGGASLGSAGQGPRSIQDTKIWKEGSAGIKQGWANYKDVLALSFRRMSRAQQEQLISQACIIVTMGVAVLVTMFFYGFIPLYFRVIGLPLILGGSWWAGKKLVSPIIITRFDDYLNKEFTP